MITPLSGSPYRSYVGCAERYFRTSNTATGVLVEEWDIPTIPNPPWLQAVGVAMTLVVGGIVLAVVAVFGVIAGQRAIECANRYKRYYSLSGSWWYGVAVTSSGDDPNVTVRRVVEVRTLGSTVDRNYDPLGLSESSRRATTIPATNEATPSPTRAMVRTLPDNNRPAPTSTAAVMWSIAVGFTSIHRNGSTKASRTAHRQQRRTERPATRRFRIYRRVVVGLGSHLKDPVRF